MNASNNGHTARRLPFTGEFIAEVKKKYPTPFYLYDETGIRENARRMLSAFSWSPGFKEFFAVKALPNPKILSILRDEGCGGDCSSLAELELCQQIGLLGEHIMFTSNNTRASEYTRAQELIAIINLDDISHIEYLEKHVGLPSLISFRYNPGPLREGNAIIGKPEEAKFGFTREQLFSGYKISQSKGVRRFGLHTMVASNELNPQFFIDTAEMLFTLANELYHEVGVRLEFVNLGGGMGIPYKPEERALDLKFVSEGIQRQYSRLIEATDLHPLAIYLENGRIMTGPFGYLVTDVIHKKSTYKEYVGVDACMANLMRPGMYNAYHHISVLGREEELPTAKFDVVGSLCENNDKFAIDRALPRVEIGDTLVIHDAGAHGHSMGFQYNGKLRCAELLLRSDRQVELIRRAETLDDYFATLNF